MATIFVLSALIYNKPNLYSYTWCCMPTDTQCSVCVYLCRNTIVVVGEVYMTIVHTCICM